MQIKSVELLQFGSVNAINEDRVDIKDSATGYFFFSDDIEFINHSDNLEGEIGLSFGISYFLNGINSEEEFQDVGFICKIIHPAIIHPVTKKSFTETVERKHAYLNRENFDYYVFEFDWELMMGTWTFQIIKDNIILLEKSFTIF